MADLKIVYVLTNPAMTGLVKIGITGQSEAKVRIAQLYTTEVPVPFDIVFAALVENAEQVEDALHTAFAPQRVNPKREFFRIEPEQAIAILKLLSKGDATSSVDEQKDQIDAESIAAGIQLRKRRPNLNFEEMQIPIDSILHCTKGDFEVTVVSPRKVSLNGEEMSLTQATRQVLQLDYDYTPSLYCTYNGGLLSKIYEETYGNTSV